MNRITRIIATGVTAGLLALGGGALAATADTAPAYHLALWAQTTADKFPQTLVTDQLTDSSDIHALDASATTCGTTYQADLYANDADTDTLIASKTLTGSGESWPGGSYADADANVITTDPCVTPPPVIDPAACVATGTSDTEAGDLAPAQTEAGLVFDGPTAVGQSKDIYYRVSSGNAEGITGMSVTYGDTSVTYPAQVVVEVSAANFPGSGFGTLSTNLAADQAVGTVDVQSSGTWYTSKIATGPGSLAWVSTGNTETYADLVSLIGVNHLLSAPSLHLQSNSPADAHSLVTSLTSSCGSFSYVPTQPAATTRQTVVTSDAVCTVNADGTFPGGGTTTTTTINFATPYIWDDATAAYIPGTEAQVGDPIVVTNTVGVDVCPATVVTPPTTTPTPTPTPSDNTTPAPVVTSNTGSLAFTGGEQLVGATIGGFLILLFIGGGITLLAVRRKAAQK